MDLMHWASLAEIIGSIAIVGSLVYVGVQVSQNSRAVRSATHQSQIEYMRETSSAVVNDAEVAALVIKGERDPASLSEVDHRRFTEYAMLQLSFFESSHLNHQDGLLDDRHYSGYEHYFRVMAATPGYVACFGENADSFIEPFKSYFASLIEAAQD